MCVKHWDEIAVLAALSRNQSTCDLFGTALTKRRRSSGDHNRISCCKVQVETLLPKWTDFLQKAARIVLRAPYILRSPPQSPQSSFELRLDQTRETYFLILCRVRCFVRYGVARQDAEPMISLLSPLHGSSSAINLDIFYAYIVPQLHQTYSNILFLAEISITFQHNYTYISNHGHNQRG